LLAECRQHLSESSGVHGPEEAVRRFGPVADLVRGFELEVAARRASRATAATACGVVGIGVSAWVMLNGVDPHARAPIAWAVVFFGAAQASAASLLLAGVRVTAMRRESGTPEDVLLLCRRGWAALAFAFLALFAVGAALPGHASAWAVLPGPMIGVVAAVAIARARRLVRRSTPPPARVVRPPLADLVAIAGRSVGARGSWWDAHPVAVLGPVVVVTAAGAFLWALADHGTVAGSVQAATVEAALTVGVFVLLGRSLGLHAALARHR
jgi:hypothetical protein